MIQSNIHKIEMKLRTLIQVGTLCSGIDGEADVVLCRGGIETLVVRIIETENSQYFQCFFNVFPIFWSTFLHLIRD